MANVGLGMRGCYGNGHDGWKWGTDVFYEPTLCRASVVHEYYIGQGLAALTRIYKYRRALKGTMYSRKKMTHLDVERGGGRNKGLKKEDAGGGLVGKVTSCCIPSVAVKWGNEAFLFLDFRIFL